MNKKENKKIKKISFSKRTFDKKKKKEASFCHEIGLAIENNPKNYPATGNWKFFKPQIDSEKCIGCGICEKFCPEGVIYLESSKGDKKPKAKIELDFCKGCGICAQVCPQKIIKLKN